VAALTFNERISLTASKALDEKIEAEKEILAAGQLDLDGYRKHTGVILGLREAKKLIAIADDEAMKT
jgi:hypothetical protein